MTAIRQIALVIPTLNEANNIVNLIKAFLALPFQWQIIVADSNSPDGTAKRVEQAFPQDDRITVLNCDQRGRGASIVHAYHWIKSQPIEFSHLAISDADFSHDPQDFPRLVEALSSADIVIGSRYLPASCIIDWPLKRRLFSRAANLLAGIMLRVGITDYTNGYRLFTRQALDVLQLDSIDADGFIHLSQELIQWHQQGLNITEVPTTFVNRRRGKSNVKLKLVIESLLVIVKLALTYRPNTKSSS